MEVTTIIIAAIIIVGLQAAFIVSGMSARKKRLIALAEAFGKPPLSPPGALEYELPSIGKYAQYMKDSPGCMGEQFAKRTTSPEGENKPLRVDSITWNDLDMDKVFARINVCHTSVGEEYLYNCLHELPLNSDRLEERENLVEFFQKHPDKRLTIQSYLAYAGKENYNGLPQLLFFGEAKMLRYPWAYNVLAVLPVLAGGLMFFNLPIGFFGVVGAFILNLMIYLRTKSLVDVEIPTIGYLTDVLRAVKRICKNNDLENLPGADELQKIYAVFKPVIRKAPSVKTTAGDLMDSAFQYVNILFLYDIRKYNTFVKLILRHRKDLHRLYRAVGEIDTALCVLSLRMSLPIAGLPKFHAENTIEFSEVFHPLLASPVTNSGRFDKPGLITGSNASGKSTFIKALAINGILAQTLNTVSARAFKMRHSLVMTSMALRDDISGGESYFIVEIKSLKRILDAVGEFPCVCFIDEILRGTNTVERLAASSAVLEFLYTRGCLCLTASHDIELTRILDGKYENFHFLETVTDGGVEFDYLLKPGPSVTRNALKLLKFTGFDPGIIERAESLAEGAVI
ncbi:MAG: hypothetical protein FWB91_01095 [Defluviitaleaceae bacterium]|nr:hypothetical protein [Defluviitaleaceae bacterium]